MTGARRSPTAGATRHGLSGHLARRLSYSDHLGVPEEMGIYRGEVATIMGALADIRVDLEYIRWLLEDDDEAEEEEDT